MRTHSLIQLFTAATLLLHIPTAATATSSVDSLLEKIRQQTEQKEAHVGVNRNGISQLQWASFAEAVAMVNQFQQFVLAERTRFELASAAVSEACLASLPKSLDAIVAEADSDIWTCVGHMATYGAQEVENGEQQLGAFNLMAALHPINATRDLFLAAWHTEEGRAGVLQHLTEQMVQWDNVTAVEMFELLQRVQEEFAWLVSTAWMACTTYGQQQIADLFEQGHQHLLTCDAA